MSVLRAGLDKPLVLQLHSTSEMNLNEEAHDDPIVNLELIMQEEDWVNHGKDEEFVDPEMVALAKQEEVHEFEKLKVCDLLKEEECRNDPRTIKIGTKWAITNKGPKLNRWSRSDSR